ncbi:sporulation protein [Paenibacillus sp. FSL H8-0548]|uniref:YhcN/YlaJ family sporulation lipoprotein n=1 Tax=Paenibacillus sp. FSL H8-0548 TaxID=1920422 RepID=UPI00096D0709|nr:YhcN/YlaJ family sporulation lipoprotein [Paenibacillus sp. FSL H8-0548]OMF37119.1 sporulation protein [Paenibacillus sp. FSL H8-0548]
MFKWFISTIIIAIVATGCSTVARNETSPSPQNNGRVKTQQTEPRKKEITNSKQVAAHLEQLAKGIDGVTNAHCVVFGNTAIVGIDVDAKLDRSRVGTIKYSVAEAFHKDPYGVDALVTADIDISERINEIGADIKRGRPILGFAEELADIVGRIIPQMPRDVMPDELEKENAPQKNKKL